MSDAEELEKNTASEVYVKRFKEQEVGIQKVGEQVTFSCANGSIKFAVCSIFLYAGSPR